MKVTSMAFQHNGRIPAKYTCQGEDVNPPLEITEIPKGTRSLALIMDDPDAPLGTWDHWVMWGLEPNGIIEEDCVPKGAIQGRNSWSRHAYGGPCPPSGTHRYIFRIYALNTELTIKTGDKQTLLDAMEGYIIEEQVLVGLYEKM